MHWPGLGTPPVMLWADSVSAPAPGAPPLSFTLAWQCPDQPRLLPLGYRGTSQEAGSSQKTGHLSQPSCSSVPGGTCAQEGVYTWWAWSTGDRMCLCGPVHVHCLVEERPPCHTQLPGEGDPQPPSPLSSAAPDALTSPVRLHTSGQWGRLGGLLPETLRAGRSRIRDRLSLWGQGKGPKSGEGSL